MIKRKKIDQVLELIKDKDCGNINHSVFLIIKNKLNRIKFEPLPGIYVLLDKNKIVYIGSTVNLFQRLLTHKGAVPYHKKMTKPMQWDGALCIVDHHLYWTNEQKLIKFYQPKYNSQYIDDGNKKVFINQSNHKQ